MVEAALMGTHSVTVEQIRRRRFSWSLVLKLQRAMVQHPTCESQSGVVLTLALRIGSGAARQIRRRTLGSTHAVPSPSLEYESGHTCNKEGAGITRTKRMCLCS